MPEYFQNALGPMEGVKAVPLVEPAVEHAVGLVAVNREPLSPLVGSAVCGGEENENGLVSVPC